MEYISLKELAEMYKLNKETIRAYAAKCQITFTRRTNKGIQCSGRSFDAIREDQLGRLEDYAHSQERLPLPTIRATLTRLKNLGLTQAEIAYNLGISQATVAGWKSGRVKAKREILPELYDMIEEVKEHEHYF